MNTQPTSNWKVILSLCGLSLLGALLFSQGPFWGRKDQAVSVAAGGMPQPQPSQQANPQQTAAAPSGNDNRPREVPDELQDDPQIKEVLRQMGEWTGDPIETTNSFVFMDGHYLHPPYIFRRQGATVWLNDRILQKDLLVHGVYQSRQSAIPDKLQKRAPEPVDGEASRQGLSPRELWALKQYILWFYSQNDFQTATTKTVEALKSFPYIKDVDVKSRYFSEIEPEREIHVAFWLTTISDEIIAAEFGYEVVNLQPTSEKAVAQIDNGIRSLNARLVREGLVWIEHVKHAGVEIWSPHSIQFRRGQMGPIVLVHDIQSSAAPLRRKYAELVKLFPEEFESLRCLVRQFVKDERFTARIDALSQEHRLPRWTYIPDPPKVIPAELKHDTRLTPQGTVKEALAALERGEVARYVREFKKPPEWVTVNDEYIQKLSQSEDLKKIEIRLRSAVTKQPVFDDLEDKAYFLFDDPQDPAHDFGKLRLRKDGHLWRIGF